MSNEGIKNIIEALIFASEDELSLKEIKDLLDNFKISVSLKEVESSIAELNSDYDKNSHAFEIIKIAGGYQFATRKKFSHFLGKLVNESQRKKLSQSAIESLAIIAYKQPITRSEIEFIRGVNVDYIVNSLLERDLITIKGRADTPGRPILYGTTLNFLRVLGLNSLEELPKLKEINEILKNEKIEGISEADIDLFNSMSTSETGPNPEITPENPELPFEENKEKTETQINEQENENLINEENVNDELPNDILDEEIVVEFPDEDEIIQDEINPEDITNEEEKKDDIT